MDVKDLLKQQEDFFFSNTTKEVAFRIEQLKKLKGLLKKNEALLYAAIKDDFGKSEFETYVSELSLVYHEINLFIKNITRWSKRKKVSTGLANFPARSYIIPEPLGITLVIGPWNYPYLLSLLPAISSMAAGNTVVIKPSELPHRTSAILAEIINEHFPSNYLYVVEGGISKTNELLAHRFDKLFFTGSIPVGKIIYQAAAKHLTPVTLELGGKSPTIVLSDADIKMTAKRIVWSKFLNAGQTCVAPDYIVVDKSIEDDFLRCLAREIEAHYSNKSANNDNYTKIINTSNFDRLSKLIDPEKIHSGGKTKRDERFISPTVLHNISFDDEVMKDEIFGPILPVISFINIDEIINKIKERPKPLACYIYSKNRKSIDKLLKEISFGGGAINDSVMHLANSNLPFGGVGLSGIGSYHGKSGFDTFSHFKSILHKPFWYESKLKYSPYSNKKLNLIKWLLE